MVSLQRGDFDTAFNIILAYEAIQLFQKDDIGRDFIVVQIIY